MAQRPSVIQHRALQMLADAGLAGCALEAMLADGFKVVTIGRLVRYGLATVATERVQIGGKTVLVPRVRITDAGSKALS